ncbi:MAG TPA: hypothetical protein VFM25_03885 [Verrucomicrobiae bacterium]|nr:hypothetical protein [Verrucomicrobiae bacterium]
MNETLSPTGTPDNRNNVEDQWVDGRKLLEILFPPDCRPTMRWLRDQQKSRSIPFVKIGRLVFFRPAQVRESVGAKQK